MALVQQNVLVGGDKWSPWVKEQYTEGERMAKVDPPANQMQSNVLHSNVK